MLRNALPASDLDVSYLFTAPANTSKETLQIRELEKLLDEYRTLLSVGDGSADSATKDQQIAQLNKTVETLKAELTLLSSKVS